MLVLPYIVVPSIPICSSQSRLKAFITYILRASSIPILTQEMIVLIYSVLTVKLEEFGISSRSVFSHTSTLCSFL